MGRRDDRDYNGGDYDNGRNLNNFDRMYDARQYEGYRAERRRSDAYENGGRSYDPDERAYRRRAPYADTEDRLPTKTREYDNEIYEEDTSRKKRGGIFRNFKREEDADGAGASNVVVCYPKTYSDVQALIDSLKNRQALVVDLAKIHDKSAQRILDFLSGAIYALDGSLQRLTETIFLLTPRGTSISIPMEIREKMERDKR